MLIRDAVADDLPRILAITNHEILTGTALWTIVPATPEGRGAWMAERQRAGYPVLVVERDGAVSGFGSYGPFRPHDGYLHTVEHSLYIDPGAARRGLGAAMLQALVEHAAARGRHAMIGGIEAGNAASIALHRRLGFRAVGTLPQVGRKFDRWLDLVFMHRLLGEEGQGAALARPLAFSLGLSAGSDDPVPMTDPTHAGRLASFRSTLQAQELDGFILPRDDEHLGEYVAPYAERLAWLTGFTGSAGVAIVLADAAAVFSDGRYVLQLAAQVDAASYQLLHSARQPPEAWLATTAAASIPGREARIGYDPWLLSEDGLARYRKPGLVLVPATENPIDAVWTDRPAPPAAAAVPHPLEFAGSSGQEKRQQVAALLRAAGEDAAVLGDPASIAWAFNLRGGDVGFTPFALGFAILNADETATLFMAGEKLPPDTRAWLGNSVRLEPPAALPAALAALSGRVVRVDPSGTAAWFGQTLRAAGATVSAAADPCLLPKARKNATERQGARDAHHADGVAVCGFLHFLSDRGVGHSETELSDRLDAFRRQRPDYRGESFPAISGAGPNGAIIHYRADPATARRLRPDEIYLIDSGGQYPSGTTDITRTVWSGPGPVPDTIRDRATRVLQGHVALARARFPAGVHGGRLDALARTPLWQAGLDYDHGTGHGVGSYLSVHEGPCRIAPAAAPIPIEAGMILSNEPGYYLPGAYGMRLENLLLVGPAATGDGSAYLEFETLTLAPFDRRLIDPALLTEPERDWIDAYHARVLREVGPALPAPALAWLTWACAALDR